MNAQQFLKERGVEHEVLSHSPSFSAQRMAGVIHVSGNDVAKTVVLNVDGKHALAVLQATHNVDVHKVKQALGVEKVELATESQFADLFPDCELGALPPFGGQYGLTTLVDESLSKDETIVFEGNNHHEAIRMKYADFAQLEQPKVFDFSFHA